MKAIYDAKTQMGPWAFLCEQHFEALGIGLGLGFGQKLKPDNVRECDFCNANGS